jgi:phosphatidylglycerophosphatase A
VVIDEVVGQWLTLFAFPVSLGGYAIGFLLFRLFDIWKPWPIRQVERRCGGGFGIMIDDVLAAVYAAAVIAIGRMLLER